MMLKSLFCEKDTETTISNKRKHSTHDFMNDLITIKKKSENTMHFKPGQVHRQSVSVCYEKINRYINISRIRWNKFASKLERLASVCDMETNFHKLIGELNIPHIL